jgi:hypothetical protein
MEIAVLPPELVRELEHAGDQPLRVENPQTKRRYVLVDVEQYDVVRRPRPTAAGANGWTEEKNERRCALIRKKFSQGIDGAEARELANLQGEVSAYRKQVAPVPYDAADALEEAVNGPSAPTP